MLTAVKPDSRLSTNDSPQVAAWLSQSYPALTPMPTVFMKSPSPYKIAMIPHNPLLSLITQDPAGCNGFGYDPIFYVPTLGKTVAQLTADEKNAISHRGGAIGKLKPILADLLHDYAG